jgi:hypothetical protein
MLFLAGVLAAGVAVGQVYNGLDDQLNAPMERAIARSNADYADVPIAGAAEDALSQEVRYANMTVPQNEANERHFNAAE